MTKYIPQCKAKQKKHTHKTNKCRPKPPKTRQIKNVIDGVRKRLDQLEDQERPSVIIPRQFTYGLVEVGTELTFREIDKQNRLYQVYTIACGLQEGVLAYILDDVVIYPSQINNNQAVTSGFFSSQGNEKVRLFFKSGGFFQKKEPILVDNTSADINFVGTDICYVTGRFIHDPDLFLKGDPDLRVVLKGKVCKDPREDEEFWTINPIVHLYDMLLADKSLGGIGMGPEFLYTDDWIAGANLGDTLVSVPTVQHKVIGSTTSHNVFQFEEPICPFQFGDVVKVSGNIPSTLNASQEYFVIVHKHIVNDVNVPEVKLASTLENSYRNIPILTGLNTKDFFMTKVKETRFASSGSYKGKLSIGVIEEWLESCSCHLTLREGKYGLILPEFPTERTIITAGDCIDTLNQTAKTDFENRTTSLTGSFTSPFNMFQEDAYPVVGGVEFETIDRGTFPQEYPLKRALKPTVAQRAAKIEFAKRRQEATVTFPGDVNLWDVNAGSIIQFDFEESEINPDETFQVISKSFVFQVEGDAPVFSLDFVAKELADNSFDLDLTNQEIIQAAKFPTINNPRNVLKPGVPNIDEELLQTVQGAGLRIKVTVSFADSGDPFLRGYEVAYKKSSESVYTFLPVSPDTLRIIFDLAPDRYDFQVRTVNTLNIKSDPSLALGVNIVGPYAIPSTVEAFRGQPTGSTILLSWRETTDLDVIVGGFFEIWHHSDPLGGQEADAILLSTVPGDLTTKTVAFMRGTYYIRAVDQVLLRGPFSEFSTSRLGPVQFARIVTADGQFDTEDLVTDEATLQQEPFWSGIDNPNTTGVIVEGTTLKLGAIGSVDEAANPGGWDSIVQFDAIGEIIPSGTYFFDPEGLVFDRVMRFRIEVQLTSHLEDLAPTSFDSRIGNVDNFLSWDTVAAPGTAEAWMECRTTRDDPLVEENWSEWRRVYTEDFLARAIQFRLQLRSFDILANIVITNARIFAREIFAEGQVEEQALLNVPTPRTGTTPKQAVYSLTVARVGMYVPNSPTSAMLLRLQQETNISSSHDNFRFSSYQASTSPWSGSGSSTVLATDFSDAIAEQDLFRSIGLHAQDVYFFLSPTPVVTDAYFTASPATDATNIIDRIRAHFRAFVEAWGPNQGVDRGDLVSFNDMYIIDDVIDPFNSANDYVFDDTVFDASLGHDWFIQVMEHAREIFPKSAKLGWNQSNVIHGFSPIPEADGTSGATQSGSSGNILNGYTNRIEDAICRYRVIRALLDAGDEGPEFIPDFLSAQAVVRGRTGATPVLRGMYLDKQAIHDFVIECNSLGVSTKLGRLRLQWNISLGGSVDTLVDADAETMKDLITTWCNNSDCNRILFLSVQGVSPDFISLYDTDTGDPTTAAGTNTVDVYGNVVDALNELYPVTERIVDQCWSHEFTSPDLVMRPVFLKSGTIVSGNWVRRAGYLPAGGTGTDTSIIYVDVADVERFGIDFERFTCVVDVFMQASNVASQTGLFPTFGEVGEPILYFCVGNGTDRTKRFVISRGKMGTVAADATDESLWFDGWNGTIGTSIFTSPVKVYGDATHALKGENSGTGTSVDFDDDADASIPSFTGALNRSTRIAFTIDKTRGIVKMSFNGNPTVSGYCNPVDNFPDFDRIYIASPPIIDSSDTSPYPRWHLEANRLGIRFRRIKIIDGVKSRSWLEQVSGENWGTIEPHTD